MDNKFESIIRGRELTEYNMHEPKPNSCVEDACKDMGINFKTLAFEDSDANYWNADSYTRQAKSNDISGYENKIKNRAKYTLVHLHNPNFPEEYTEAYYSDYVVIIFDYSDKNHSSLTILPRCLGTDNDNRNTDSNVLMDNYNKGDKVDMIKIIKEDVDNVVSLVDAIKEEVRHKTYELGYSEDDLCEIEILEDILFEELYNLSDEDKKWLNDILCDPIKLSDAKYDVEQLFDSADVLIYHLKDNNII